MCSRDSGMHHTETQRVPLGNLSVDNLTSSFLPQCWWSEYDSRNTPIALGDTVESFTLWQSWSAWNLSKPLLPPSLHPLREVKSLHGCSQMEISWRNSLDKTASLHCSSCDSLRVDHVSPNATHYIFCFMSWTLEVFLAFLCRPLTSRS